jgi:hypothetical protein
MSGTTEGGAGRRGSRWRLVAWASAALLLLMPLVAMQFTDEVAWNAADFAFAGALIVGTGVAYELAARTTGNHAYRVAVGFALAATFLLVWLNAAVGIIGTEDNPANWMYGGVLAVGIVGAVMTRFAPRGMARALVATALAQALVAVIAVMAGLGHPTSPPLEILGVNAIFTALWLISAWLFRKAAREQTPAAAGAVGG